MHGKCRDHPLKNPKSDMLRTLVPQPLHYSFILTNVLQKVLLEAAP